MYEKLFKIWKRRGLEPFWFDTKEEAAEFLCRELVGRSITISGCHTAEEMGLYDLLSEKNSVFWHWRNSDYQAKRQAELRGDVYICSANGVAETGELINIDGSCNRLANSMYAQELVIFVIGKNKIAPDFEKALWRARNIAAPMNVRRQNAESMRIKTPCAVGELKCHDCSSPDRICRAMSVIWEKPIPMNQMWVLVIGEDAGY